LKTQSKKENQKRRIFGYRRKGERWDKGKKAKTGIGGDAEFRGWLEKEKPRGEVTEIKRRKKVWGTFPGLTPARSLEKQCLERARQSEAEDEPKEEKVVRPNTKSGRNGIRTARE